MTESNIKKLQKIREYARFITDIIEDINLSEVKDMTIESIIVDKLPSCCDNCKFSDDLNSCYYDCNDIYCSVTQEVLTSSNEFNKLENRSKICPLILKKWGSKKWRNQILTSCKRLMKCKTW